MKTKNIGNIIRTAYLASALIVAPYLGGCEDNKSENPQLTNSTCEQTSSTSCNQNHDDSTAENSSQTFAITSPNSGDIVTINPIKLCGVGLKRSKLTNFRVRVKTDDWYEQNGNLDNSSKSSWEYSPVYVSGQGEYNNHTIEVTASYNDGTSDSATLENIVRQD